MQQKTSTKEEYLKRINILVEYINNHLGENIDLELLADMSNFSPYHFHRIVKAFLGEPIGAFIVRMRIETAARLLRYSDMSVQNIAYKVGYDVPSSLSKVFKQFYGISPNDFRNNKTYTIMKPLQINSELDLNERVIDLEPRQVIYIRLTGDYKKNDYCEAWQKLWNYVKVIGLFSADVERICKDEKKSEILEKVSQTGIEHICIYHDDPKVTDSTKLRTDVCLTLPKEVKPKGEIGVKEVAGGKYAVYRYQGSYENLGMVYDTIYGKYIPEGGYRLASNPGFEKYLNDPDCTASDKLMTEIYVPIQ